MKTAKINEVIGAISALVEGWEDNKSIPQIEIDIAKNKIQKLYLMVSKVDGEPCLDVEDDSCAEKEVKIESEEVENISAVVTEQVIDEPEADEFVNEDEVAAEPEEYKTPKVEDFEGQMEDVEADEFKEEEVSQESEEETIEPEQDDEDEEPAVNLAEVRELHYINTLFGGDRDYYNAQMRKINALESFDDVLIYISENFAWSGSNQSAQSFVETQSERFA